MQKRQVVIDQESLRTLQERKQNLQKVESFPYSEYLSSVMDSHVYTCKDSTMVSEVLRVMADRGISSSIIVDDDNKVKGIITERDVMQRVVTVEGHNWSKTPVNKVMTPDPVVLAPGNSIYRALSLLSSKKIKHLPLVEDDKVVGIVTMRQLIKLRYPEPMTLIEQIWAAANAADLLEVRNKLPKLAQAKLIGGRRGYDIVVMISLINRDIHRRVMELVEMEMGGAPIKFCVYVTGSHGRLENLLTPDQDHGMIIADGDEQQYYAEYFKEFSHKVSQMLERTDFQLCPGNVMCSNPLWRKSLTEWKQQIEYWFESQVEDLGRFCTILFDASCIYGEVELFSQLREYAFELLSNHLEVLRIMHEEEGSHKAPIGWLGRFITEKNGEHRGELNLKRSGLIFVVEGIRILSLLHGINQTSTIKRIDRLIKEGHIHQDDGEYFESAYHFLLHLALKVQVEKMLNGQAIDTFIDPSNLSRRDKETLRHAFKAVTTLQDMVAAEFGELVI